MKKALLIGIDYVNDKESYIGGCVQDVLDVEKMLIDDLGYEKENIVMLRDDVDDVEMHPTATNIMRQLLSVIHGSDGVDEFWLHYSGHGSQMNDRNGEELDGKDEIIIPIDYRTKGVINDDLLKQVAQHLTCKTIMVFDCCHSGTICDLPYHYDVIEHKMKHVVQNSVGCKNKEIYKISGCRDNQVSLSVYDVWSNKMKGACTSALIEILHEQSFDISFEDLLVKMNEMMKEKKSKQCPTYATSDPDTLGHNVGRVLGYIQESPVEESQPECKECPKHLETIKEKEDKIKEQEDKIKEQEEDINEHIGRARNMIGQIHGLKYKDKYNTGRINSLSNQLNHLRSVDEENKKEIALLKEKVNNLERSQGSNDGEVERLRRNEQSLKQYIERLKSSNARYLHYIRHMRRRR